MSWAALNGHVRDPPILDLPAAATARENGEGGGREAGVGRVDNGGGAGGEVE